MSHLDPELMAGLAAPGRMPIARAAVWVGPLLLHICGPSDESEMLRPGDQITIVGLDGIGTDADFIVKTSTGPVFCCAHRDVTLDPRGDRPCP